MSTESMAIRLLDDTTAEAQHLLLTPNPSWGSESLVRALSKSLDLYDDLIKLVGNTHNREERTKRAKLAHVIALLQGIYYPKDAP